VLGVGKQDARDIRHGHFAVWATCEVIEALVAQLKLHVPDHNTIAEFRRCEGRALRAA
jgi:hypothetical protein